MKKLIFVVIIAILIPGIGIGLYFLIPHLTVVPVEGGQITNTNIHVIKNGLSNVFLLKVETDYIMFDTGSDANKLKTSLEDANINVLDIKWIFISHSDSDHVAGLNIFPNAEIFMSADELPLINGSQKRFGIFKNNKLPSGINIDNINLLQNQTLLFSDIKIECIKTPGHTIGSMVYLVNDQYVFTGDAFRVKNGNILVHPFPMDRKLSINSIKQLKEIINSSSIIATSHYGYYNKLSFDIIK